MVLVAPTIKKIWPCIQRSKYGWWRLELSKIEKKHTTAILAQKCENIKNTKTKPKTHAKEIIVKNKAKCKKFFWGQRKKEIQTHPRSHVKRRSKKNGSCKIQIQKHTVRSKLPLFGSFVRRYKKWQFCFTLKQGGSDSHQTRERVEIFDDISSC